MTRPPLLIMGAGAVGSYLGLMLSDAYEVFLVGRYDRIGSGQREFRLRRLDGTSSSARVTAVNDLDGLPAGFRPVGVIVSTKTAAVESALKAIASRHREWAMPWLVMFQNGIGSEESAAREFGVDKVVSGTLTKSVTLSGDSECECECEERSGGGIALAPLSSGLGPTCRDLAKAFAARGVLCRCVGDHRSLKWSKLVLNGIANGVCALTDRTPAEVVGDQDLFAIEVECARETLAVMDALSVRTCDLPGYPVRFVSRLLRVLPTRVLQRTLGRKIARSRGDKLPSLLLDVRAGRTATEADAMYGAVARAGELVGVSTPVASTIADLFRQGARRLCSVDLLSAVAARR